MPLAKCSHLFGGCYFHPEPPRIERHRTVLVHDWTLYDEHRRIIPLSAFFREFGEFKILGGAATSNINSASSLKLGGGPFFWLGGFHRHFGHFFITTVARLWAYSTIIAEETVKIAYSGGITPAQIFDISYAAEILSAIGIGPDDLVQVPQYGVLSDVIVAGPCLIENNSIHAAYSSMMMKIADTLVPEAPEVISERPLYFSKERLGAGVSKIVNEAEFTEVLAREGVQVVYPETLTLRDQIRLWRGHRVFAGYAGSALHCAAFTQGRSIVSLCHDRFAQSNQALIARAGQHHMLFVHPEGGVETLPPAAGFSASHRLHAPVQTAEAFLRAMRRLTVSPASEASHPHAASASVCRFLYPDEPFGDNISINKVARQSSSDPDWEIKSSMDDASMAVSGTLSPTYQFCTRNEMPAWWDVDLGAPFLINEIRIYNRNDVAADRAAGVIILFSDDGQDWVEMDRRDPKTGVFGGFNTDPYRWKATRAVTTRFVRLQLPSRDYLHLNQVEVFGQLATAPYF